MTLGAAISTVRRILGQGCMPEDYRRYSIEHTALMDVWNGHPYDDQRWNITEAYTYREAYARGSLQLELEGKGEIAYRPTQEEA